MAAELDLEAHHHVLAHRVDGRVGDLREQLLEVGEERRRAVGEHGERGVGAHRAVRLLAGVDERREQDPHVLLRVAERELALVQGARRARGRRRRRQVLEPERVLGMPAPVGVTRGQPPLDLAVGQQLAGLDVGDEHRPRLQPPAPYDLGGVDLERARLRRAHHPAVARLQPAARAQAVAVEHRAGQLAVAERDRRRPVPRLHQQRVEVGEAVLGLGDLVAALLRLGDHQLERVRHRAAGAHQQLEHRVDRGRVRRLRVDGRQHGGELVAEQVGGELALARPHPVAVAGERVDLAVVGDQPVRVGERPARERVGREARVQQRERRGAALVAQVGVEGRELRRPQHALVDDGASREGTHDELAPGARLGRPAGYVEAALERVGVALEVVGGDRELADRGHALARQLAQRLGLDRHVAPPEHAQAARRAGVLQLALEHPPARRLGGQEAHRDPVLARRGQRPGPGLAQQRVGELEHQARAVAGGVVGALGAAVVHAHQAGERAADAVVGRPPGKMGDEPDSAHLAQGSALTGPVFGPAAKKRRARPPRGPASR